MNRGLLLQNAHGGDRWNRNPETAIKIAAPYFDDGLDFARKMLRISDLIDKLEEIEREREKHWAMLVSDAIDGNHARVLRYRRAGRK